MQSRHEIYPWHELLSTPAVSAELIATCPLIIEASPILSSNHNSNHKSKSMGQSNYDSCPIECRFDSISEGNEWLHNMQSYYVLQVCAAPAHRS